MLKFSDAEYDSWADKYAEQPVNMSRACGLCRQCGAGVEIAFISGLELPFEAHARCQVCGHGWRVKVHK